MSSRGWWNRAFERDVYPLPALAASEGFRQRTRLELPFIKKALRLKKDSALLDVCCGVGRHTVPLAKSGVKVTGIDISARFLREARKAAAKAGVDAELLRRDIRELGFRESFDAALNAWTSFGYFPEKADDLKALRSMRRALKPGGLLLLDTINGARIEEGFRRRAAMGRGENESWLELEDGTFILERAEHLPARKATVSRWVFLKGTRRREMESFTRLYDRPALDSLLRRAGWRPLRYFGEMAFEPYERPASPRLVVLARNP